MSLAPSFWRARFPNWPPLAAPLADGYTVLVPVPGDLPGLTRLALAVLGQQQAAHRVATIVVPDQKSPAVEAIVASAQGSWSGALDVRELPLPERWFLVKLRSASRVHWLQVVTGMGAVGSTYALLHDADLFLLDHAVLDTRFTLAQERGLACLGVNQVWDEWYASKGRTMVATWEMLASVEWFRSFTPAEHGPHDGTIWGEHHTFDTTLHPQALTAPDRVAVEPIPAQSMVNFNYAIATYRMFQRAKTPFLDSGFRLLLLSVLTAVYGGQCDVPPLEELSGYLGTSGRVLEFPTGEDGVARYRDFRTSLGSVLRSELVPADEARRAERLLAPIDDHYSWSAG